MGKYIPADKLIAEIERRKAILNKYKDSFETAACCKQELEWMKDFIASLQQEQPKVDFEKEIEEYFGENWKEGTPIEVQDDMIKFARDFWNKGYYARKEE